MALCNIIAPTLLAVPVVDIDYTIFVQAGIFLGLVFILNPLLFKPWLATQARRSEAIDGALELSKRLRADAETLASEYDERLSDARAGALELRSKARRGEESKQADKLAGVREEAAAAFEKERKELAAQAEQAKAALSGRVDELAAEITQKVLGRAS